MAEVLLGMPQNKISMDLLKLVSFQKITSNPCPCLLEAYITFSVHLRLEGFFFCMHNVSRFWYSCGKPEGSNGTVKSKLVIH